MRLNRLLAYFLGALSLAGVCAASDLLQPAFGTVTVIASTVPSNGNLNPYGVASKLRESNKRSYTGQ